LCSAGGDPERHFLTRHVSRISLFLPLFGADSHPEEACDLFFFRMKSLNLLSYIFIYILLRRKTPTGYPADKNLA
jgi:hypothetical protein